MITNDFFLTDPQEVLIWKAAFESQAAYSSSPATYGGDHLYQPGSPPLPHVSYLGAHYRQGGETVRPQASDAAPRILSIPVTKCSQSWERAERKRALRRGGQERNGRPESSARCLCLCIPICDRANFSQIP